MKSYEIVGYALGGEVYCKDCAMGMEFISDPVFADSEWAEYPVCDGCGEQMW